MGGKNEAIQKILEKEMAAGGVQGIVLASRDGLPVASRGSAVQGAETIAAMSAALLASAEAAMGEIGSDGTRRVVVETNAIRLVASGISEAFFLVTLAPKSKALDAAVAQHEAAGAALGKAVAGA